MRRYLIAGLVLLASPAMSDHELKGRDLKQGRALYGDYCAVCHGADLQGQPDWQTPDDNGLYRAPPHDETGHTWHHSNQQLFDYTRLGGAEALAQAGVEGFRSGMPSFGDQLDDDQIWDILAWIASTWPRREANAQARRNPAH